MTHPKHIAQNRFDPSKICIYFGFEISIDNKSSCLDVHYISSSIQAIIVSPTGWANAATIDILYDLLHMMGRDDIPVGLGDVFAMHQSDPNNSAVGDCKYAKAIPYGSGGLIDSDTLYGLARDFPRSPRRYLKLLMFL